MDVTEKVNLVSRPPTEEVVTKEELLELFKTNSKPKHYIGIEISGFLHLGSLISTGFKINDFVKAGVDCTVFLADWHTLLNEKMGGNFETFLMFSKLPPIFSFNKVCQSAKKTVQSTPALTKSFILKPVLIRLPRCKKPEISIPM